MYTTSDIMKDVRSWAREVIKVAGYQANVG